MSASRPIHGSLPGIRAMATPTPLAPVAVHRSWTLPALACNAASPHAPAPSYVLSGHRSDLKLRGSNSFSLKPSGPNAVRLSSFALSLSKGEWASIVRQAHDSARTANRTVLHLVPDTEVSPRTNRQQLSDGRATGCGKRHGNNGVTYNRLHEALGQEPSRVWFFRHATPEL